MKKTLIISVIVLIILAFTVNFLIKQNKSYQAGLEELKEHYEETKYDDSFTIYLDNHFGNKNEFKYSKEIGGEIPIEFKNKECFEYGLNKKIISGSWKEGDVPFCISDFNYECVSNNGLNIEGIADESKNNCKNTLIINCTCWF